MSREGARCRPCTPQLVARTRIGSGPHPAGSPAKSCGFPGREARGAAVGGPSSRRPQGALLWGLSWNLLPAAKFKAGMWGEGAAGSGWGELLIHGHKSAFRKAAEGLGRSCVPTFNSKPWGGGDTGPGPSPPGHSVGPPRRSAPAPGGGPGGGACPPSCGPQVGAWIRLAPPCSSDLHTTPTERAPARAPQEGTTHQAPPADRNRQNPTAPPRGGREGTGRWLSMGKL